MFGNSSLDRGSSRAQSMKACNDHYARRQALCDEPTYNELESEHGGGGAARGERDWTRYAVQDCIHDEDHLNGPLQQETEPPSYANRNARSAVTHFTLNHNDPFNDNTVTMRDPRNLQRERTRIDHSTDVEAMMQQRKIELMSEIHYNEGFHAQYTATDEEGLSNRGSLGCLGPIDLDDTYSAPRSCRDERQKESIAQFKASAASALKRGSYSNNGMYYK